MNLAFLLIQAKLNTVWIVFTYWYFLGEYTCPISGYYFVSVAVSTDGHHCRMMIHHCNLALETAFVSAFADSAVHLYLWICYFYSTKFLTVIWPCLQYVSSIRTVWQFICILWTPGVPIITYTARCWHLTLDKLMEFFFFSKGQPEWHIFAIVLSSYLSIRFVMEISQKRQTFRISKKLYNCRRYWTKFHR